jgi:hypothetical protein
MRLLPSLTLTIGLLAAAAHAGAGEPLHLRGAVLHLLPGGAAVLQKDVELTLPAGASQRTLMLVPLNLAGDALQIAAVDEDSGTSISEWSLTKSGAAQEVAGCRELSARIACAQAGNFTFRVTFPLAGLTWSGTNTCRPVEDGLAELSSTLHLENRSGVGLDDAQIRVPCPAEEPAAAPARAWLLHAQDAGGADPARHKSPAGALATPTFALDQTVTIGPRESKSVRVGVWRMSFGPRRYVVRSDFASGPYGSTPSASSPQAWKQVRTAVEQVLQLKTSQGSRPAELQLVPGKLRIARFAANSFTDVEVPHWRVADGVVELYLPSEDLVCRRNQLTHTTIFADHVYQVRMQVEVKSGLDQAAEVEVIEPLLESSRVVISEASQPYNVIAGRELAFSFTLPAGDSRTITYQVRYELD